MLMKWMNRWVRIFLRHLWLILDYISDFYCGIGYLWDISDKFRILFSDFYFGNYFWIICDAFQIFGCGGKKKIKTGAYPLPYDLDFSYSLVCGYIWSCILLLHIHKTVEWIKLMFHPTKQFSSWNWCFCTSFGRNPLCSCPHIC